MSKTKGMLFRFRINPAVVVSLSPSLPPTPPPLPVRTDRQVSSALYASDAEKIQTQSQIIYTTPF